MILSFPPLALMERLRSLPPPARTSADSSFDAGQNWVVSVRQCTKRRRYYVRHSQACVCACVPSKCGRVVETSSPSRLRQSKISQAKSTVTSERCFLIRNLHRVVSAVGYYVSERGTPVTSVRSVNSKSQGSARWRMSMAGVNIAVHRLNLQLNQRMLICPGCFTVSKISKH
jgi:hypothetical protein